MREYKKLMLAGAIVLATAAAAHAAGLFTNGVPQAGGTQYPTTLPLTGAETIPADTNLPSGLNPASEAITTAQLAGYSGSVTGQNGLINGLIGGDMGTNLWQRGTSITGISNTATYTADRWFAYGGASSSITVSKSTSVTPASFAASLLLQRASANADTSAICVAQVLTSANSTRFQGKTVEFSFSAEAGANFSGTGVVASIIYGTGTDQSSANFASGSWTGQTTAGSQTIVPGSSGFAVYSTVAAVPSTAIQLGVKVCYTPVGTAGATDGVYLDRLQLDVNPAAVPSTGVAGTASSVKSFEHRPVQLEAAMEYAYFYRLSEPASGAAINGSCQATGASTNICNVFLPVVMRAATPTITITTAGTFKVNIAGTATTIATPTASTCSNFSCAVTAANTNTAGQAELLSGGGGTGKWDISAEL